MLPIALLYPSFDKKSFNAFVLYKTRKQFLIGMKKPSSDIGGPVKDCQRSVVAEIDFLYVSGEDIIWELLDHLLRLLVAFAGSGFFLLLLLSLLFLQV